MLQSISKHKQYNIDKKTITRKSFLLIIHILMNLLFLKGLKTTKTTKMFFACWEAVLGTDRPNLWEKKYLRVSTIHWQWLDCNLYALPRVTLSTKQELSSCWDGRPFGHNRQGPKVGRGCCGGWVFSGSPSDTMWPGPKPTSLPSGILIHPTFWPQL